MVGDIVFGAYQFPKSFIVSANELAADSDVVSIPTSIGSSVPTPKWASRQVNVQGFIGGHLHDAQGNELLTLADIQSEVDSVMGGLNAAIVNGAQPLVLPSWDRYVVGYAQKPKRTDIEGSGYRYSQIDIPIFCGDPRAFLCTPGNWCPDSDMKLLGQTWPGAPGLTFSQNVSGQNAMVYVGTGSASGFVFRTSAIFYVQPGQTYTLSGFVDGSHVSSGTPGFSLFNPQGSGSSYVSAQQSPFSSGFVQSAPWTVPAGVYQVIVIPDTNNCTVQNGQNLIFRSPKLEFGTARTAYAPDILTPQHIAYAAISSTTPASINAANNGNTRSYPTIVLAANSGANVGFKGITIVMTNPDGTALTIALSASCVVSNGQILYINCDPVRPSAIIAPGIPPRSAFVGSNTQWPFATFSSTAAGMELLPYLDPGASSLTITVGAAPSGGSIGLEASIIWDDAVI